MVCIQGGRESGRAGFVFFVFPPLYLSIYISPGVCGAQGVQALFYSRRWRLWFKYKWDWRAGARYFFFVLWPLHFSTRISPKVCGGQGGASASILSAAALVVCIQSGREGGRAGFVFWCFRPCICSFTFFPDCVRGRGCKRFSTLGGGAYGMHTSGTGGRARVFFFLCASALVFFHLYFFQSVCGTGGASASLLSAAAFVVCIPMGREGRRAGFFLGFPLLY